MIHYTTKNGTQIELMTPEGNALSIMPAEGKAIVPADLAEFASWLKRDPLRCYVAVDAFLDVAMQQLFPPTAAEQLTVDATEKQLDSAIDASNVSLEKLDG